MSIAKDYYDRTYGMSFGMYCQLATGNQPKCVIETRNAIAEGKELDWVWTTKAKDILNNEMVAKVVKECGLV